MRDLDRDHLCKLLGLLGSAFPGERAAAGLKAHEFIHGLKMTWPEVISPPLAPPDAPPRSDTPGFAELYWMDALQFCLARRHRLRERDRDFLESLNAWGRMPSRKQLRWPEDILVRLTRGQR